MKAVLGFGFLCDRGDRPIPELVVRVCSDETTQDYPISLVLCEVSGRDDDLRGVLRRLFGDFLRGLPEQRHRGVTMHVLTECTAPPGSPFRREIIRQLEEIQGERLRLRRTCQKELILNFRNLRTRVVCFMLLQ